MGGFFGTFTFGVVGSYGNGGADDLSTALQSVNYIGAVPFTPGTGPSQANAWTSASFSCAAGVSDLWDLNTGIVSSDVFGVPLNFTKIKALYLHNKSVTAGEVLTISGDFVSSSLGVTTGTILIHPSGWLSLLAPLTGYTVTQTSADTLLITNNNASAVAYELFLLGIV